MLTVGIHGIPDPLKKNRTHDHSIAFLRDGDVIAHMELERLTREKHDGKLGKYLSELICKVWDGKEPIRFASVNSFLGGNFQSDCLSISSEEFKLANQYCKSQGAFSIPGRNIKAEYYTVAHEIAHLGTCLPFVGNFKNNSLLVHIDGGAWVSNASVWHWKNNQLKLLDFLWDETCTKSAVNNFNANPLTAFILGLDLTDHLSMPGKLMGLAPYGHPNPELMQFLKENDWFKNWEKSSYELEQLFSKHFGENIVFNTKNKMSQDIAFCMQQDFETKILGFMDKYQKKSGAYHLYYSGGAALNIHTNSKIENNLNFKSVFIPPAPSDCGLALGAAAFLEWEKGVKIPIHSAYLNSLTCQSENNLFPETPIKKIAEMVSKGEIIATCLEKGEIGPRALGHRSILSRPDDIKLRRHLSETMKQREWYRPVAPLILEDIAQKALINYRSESVLGRYMLGVWKVHPDWQQFFKGIIHADGTVRAQIVRKGDSKLKPVYQLLKILDEIYEIKGCINTSFNSKGIPIVQSLEDAKKEAEKLGITFIWS